MKVRMKVTIAGLVDGQRATEGAVIDVPDTNGADLCAKGYAEPVAEKPSERAEVRADTSGHVCGVCGKEAASKAGLAAHKRSHDEG